jgi:hypothetical protein
VDPDPDPVTGPAFHADADLDPASQKYADPDRQHWLIHQNGDSDMQLCMCKEQGSGAGMLVSVFLFFYFLI